MKNIKDLLKTSLIIALGTLALQPLASAASYEQPDLERSDDEPVQNRTLKQAGTKATKFVISEAVKQLDNLKIEKNVPDSVDDLVDLAVLLEKILPLSGPQITKMGAYDNEIQKLLDVLLPDQVKETTKALEDLVARKQGLIAEAMQAGKENNPDRMIECCKEAMNLDAPIEEAKYRPDEIISAQKTWQAIKNQIDDHEEDEFEEGDDY